MHAVRKVLFRIPDTLIVGNMVRSIHFLFENKKILLNISLSPNSSRAGAARDSYKHKGTSIFKQESSFDPNNSPGSKRTLHLSMTSHDKSFSKGIECTFRSY
jgi:hypothetical protein